MFILHTRGGYRYQAELWRMYLSGRLTLHDSTPAELVRMARLMDDYEDTPMDLADASLVALAESRRIRAIFTFDHLFWIFRLTDGSAMEPIPSR